MNNEEKILGILESMQSDISGLKGDVSTLKQGQMNLESRMESGFADVKKSIGTLVHVINRVDDRVVAVMRRLETVELLQGVAD